MRPYRGNPFLAHIGLGFRGTLRASRSVISPSSASSASSYAPLSIQAAPHFSAATPLRPFSALRTRRLLEPPVVLSFLPRSFSTLTTLRASGMTSPVSISEPLNNRNARLRIEERIEDLERPALDDRSYRVITLPNKLEVLLVHDPKTDKVSAALDVNVGSFSDAEDMPGIAHAVEHLLFMGTEKYPKENAYNQYLTAHSGYSNAYTSATSTNYYFEVAASSSPSSSQSSSANSTQENLPSLKDESPLYGALDRFGQFFIKPLFLEDTVDREIKAVDSENKKNLQSDTWRLHQLNKALANPNHPYCHFSTGSWQTLHDDPISRGVRIRDEFIKFYTTHYSANRMKLVILGREGLDDLQDWAEEIFSQVPNTDLPKLRWEDVSVYTEKELLTQTFAKPVTEMRNLEFSFLYRDEEAFYESHPGRYLSHLIGHEGPGSILAYIKAKGWANGLGAGAQSLCPGSGIFNVQVKLTEDGLKHYKEVAKVVFQYIAMMRESPPQKWIVDELIRMSQVDFRFKQKSPPSRTTSALGSVMQKPYDRKMLLSGPAVIRKFDSEAISQALSYLRPDNFRLTIVSQEFPGDWNQKEKWYGTEFKHEKIPEDFLSEIRKAFETPASERPAELHLPHKNEFIPNRLEVEKKEVEQPLKYPKLIRNDENIRTWYKKDDQFWVPKANVHITLRSPMTNVTPRAFALSTVYRDLVYDALVEYSYDADISGLTYEFLNHSMGLSIFIEGYNDKMPVLLEKVLLQIRDLEVREDRFRIVKERLMRSFRNWDFQMPYHQVGTFSRWLTQERGWINEQLLAELPTITAAEVQSFFPQLLGQCHIEVLAHGNLYKEEALQVTDLVESTLKPRKLPPTQWPVRRSVILPPGSNFVYERTLKDPSNVNHCIEYILYAGNNSDRPLRARLLLAAQMTDEPAFDQLRTKEQLGYVVFSGASISGTWAGYRILIQSEKSPEYLEGRIDSFLNGFEKTLEEMTEEQFENHKRSVINKRLEKVKNLTQESTRFWNHVFSECYDFEQADQDVAHLTPLTKADLVEFYKQYISTSSPSRAKLSIHMLAQATPKPTSAPELKFQTITLLSKVLAANNIPFEQSTLESRFKDLSFEDSADKQDNQTKLISTILTYLSQDLRLEQEKVEKVLEQGEAAMGIAVVGPGGQTPEVESDKKEQVRVGNGTTPILIKDVHDWKAGLEVSRAARPVRDLSDFEELEAKL